MMIAPFLRQQTPVASILFTRVIVAGLEGEPLPFQFSRWIYREIFSVSSVDKSWKFLWKEFNKKIYCFDQI